MQFEKDKASNEIPNDGFWKEKEEKGKPKGPGSRALSLDSETAYFNTTLNDTFIRFG